MQRAPSMRRLAAVTLVVFVLEIPIALTVALVTALLAERLIGARQRTPLPALEEDDLPSPTFERERREPAPDEDDGPAPTFEREPAPLWSHGAR